MSRKSILVLFGILLLGFLLRVYKITTLPMYGDELTTVYDTYSVLKTGHDQLGNFLPITFQMGAGRPAGYIYFSIPFVAIFGPTALGVRSLSILSGLGMIVIMYFLGKRLFNQNTGFIAAFLIAISPWDLSLSRGGFEAHFALMLAILGLLFFLMAKDNPKYYLGFAVAWGLSIHTYSTYKLTLFLILALLIWFDRGAIRNFLSKGYRWFKIIALVVGAVAVLVSVQQTLFGKSEQRFTDINIFADPAIKQQIIQKVNFERSIDSIGENLSQYFHNRPVEYFVSLRNAYLDNLSFNFLFISGDGNPVHNMTGIGELYLVEIVLILVSLVILWNKNRKIFIFLVSWIFLAPVAAALLITPHALRDSFMLPPLVLLSAVGLSEITDIRNRRNKLLFFLLIGAPWLLQFIFLLDKLYFLSPVKYYNFWSYPAEVAAGIANDHMRQYDYIFLSDQIDNIQYAYPVYNKIDPNIVIAANKTLFDFGKYKFKKFGNVYITNIPDNEVVNFINSINGSVLYVIDVTENVEGTVLNRVYSPTGQRMLSIIKKEV